MIQSTQREREFARMHNVYSKRQTFSRDTCAECGAERPVQAMNSKRVPGVGTVRTCRGKHAA